MTTTVGPTRHLVIMARAPRLGRVKRRLARDIGAGAAHPFYRDTTAGLLRALSRDTRWQCWLAVTPDAAALEGRGLWGTKCPVVPQGHGDLGQRMGRLLWFLPPGPLVIVGSDIPGIRAEHIAAAFARLGDHDWVLGPAPDGGYWLIGARRRPVVRIPFRGVRWSSEHTLSDTLANIGDRRGARLAELADVDSGADLERWRAERG
jgi:rSAM/selenodomain-associated transferase 1